MDIESHFKGFSTFENRIQNFKILKFVEHFEIKDLNNLKNLNSWIKINDSGLKRRIYNKVYYIEKKGRDPETDLSAEDVGVVAEHGASDERCDTPQIFSNKQKNLPLILLHIAVVTFSLIFLMNESRHFYLSYGFGQFNAAILPLLVECSILLLSLSPDLKSKSLMILLVAYNVVSFSFFTISEYDKHGVEHKGIQRKNKILLEEKSMLQVEYQTMKSELSKYRSKYEAAVKSRYVTRANELYLPQIKTLEESFLNKSARIAALNRKILSLGEIKSMEILLVGTIAIIFLKLILQLVSILFIKKLAVLMSERAEPLQSGDNKVTTTKEIKQ